MSQFSSDCGCNDYSLLIANTGIAFISSAVTATDGTGATPVLTAAHNGTIIKSVIIKSIQPVTLGLIRLFINGGGVTTLYKEIPVPKTPVLDSTPTPAPVLQTFEITLVGGLKLKNGYRLFAATTTAQSFNVIAEGLDWKYPSTLPGTCCNFKQIEAVTGLANINNANTNLDGSGNIGTIFTVPSSVNGAVIKSITIKALQGTNEGMVRIYIGADTSHFKLLKEITIPQTNPGNFDPFFKEVVNMDLSIATGFILGASTQLAEGFSITVEAADWTYPIS